MLLIINIHKFENNDIFYIGYYFIINVYIIYYIRIVLMCRAVDVTQNIHRDDYHVRDSFMDDDDDDDR